ncbi:hypothetical protein HDV63DRAFT_399194 [Trichoderma sp. SZMC 28014]
MAIAQGPSACALDEVVDASKYSISSAKLRLMAANNALPVCFSLHGDGTACSIIISLRPSISLTEFRSVQ